MGIFIQQKITFSSEIICFENGDREMNKFFEQKFIRSWVLLILILQIVWT